MYYLGLNMFSHDSAAVLMKDGKIICALEEERLNRKKHYTGFPKLAIQACLDYAKISFDDVDVVSCEGLTFNEAKEKVNLLIKNNMYWEALGDITTLQEGNYSTSMIKNALIKNGLKSDCKIEYHDHHTCHAASAYYFSGYDDSLVLTSDERGHSTTFTVKEGNNKYLNPLSSYKIPYSLGYVYKYITLLCGFGPFNQGTTMALASYGKPKNINFNYLLKPLISHWVNIIDLKMRINNSINYKDCKIISKAYKMLKKKKRNSLRNIECLNKKDLAASVQHWLENEVKKIALKFKCNHDNLCLAGGTFYNCIINSQLKDYFKNVYIHPAAGDAGLALGAISLSYKKKCMQLDHPFLGLDFNNNVIEETLLNYPKKVRYEKTDIKHIAELLASNKIIGWFQGRMEWGPRALGSRSILANPRDMNNKKRLDETIKIRESFRPYAPSILNKKKESYFENSWESPFMTFVFNVKKEKQKEIPAVVHNDGTARVQTVDKNNQKYYKLIKNFESLTGIPLVLNTSFNGPGEPIVCQPKEALEFFYKSDMDYLFMEDFIIYK